MSAQLTDPSETTETLLQHKFGPTGTKATKHCVSSVPVDGITAVGVHQSFPGEWEMIYFEYASESPPATPLRSSALLVKKVIPSCRAVKTMLPKEPPGGAFPNIMKAAPKEGFVATRQTGRDSFVWRFDFADGRP